MKSEEVKAIEQVANELKKLNNKLDKIHKDVIYELKAARPKTINEIRESMGYEPVTNLGDLVRQVVDGDKGEE